MVSAEFCQAAIAEAGITRAILALWTLNLCQVLNIVLLYHSLCCMYEYEAVPFGSV
jgi:hypothetical protein